jgi:hypothetical protein
MTLHFENRLDNKPNQKIAIFLDVAAIRAQAARSFGSNQFNIDYSYMVKSIAEQLGSINLIEMFITIIRYDRKDNLDNFLRHARKLGILTHICTTFRNERILKSDPEASSKLAGYAGSLIQTDDEGWTVIGGAKPKITTKVDMAAAISAAAHSGRFDCIILGTTDSIFSSVISRHVIPLGINCGIVFIQNDDRPEFIDRTINGEFLSMFNYKLRFDNETIINHRETNESSIELED